MNQLTLVAASPALPALIADASEPAALRFPEFFATRIRGSNTQRAHRCAVAGIAGRLGNHSFRDARVATYLINVGTLKKAAQMANHASARVTQHCDSRREGLNLDEVERIRV